MNFDLHRMTRVLAALGNPQRRFPAVHVAGTNGKGSVSTLIAAALRESGHRTGLYTSPHLERLSERFQVNGAEAREADIARLSRRVARAFRTESIRPTQFEFLTALAFLYFADAAVDIAVVEVGLGGRLDATNALEHVAASVITNIGLDHMEWLGHTPGRIAAEKAGIIRPRVPVVTGAEGEALVVISAAARAATSPLTMVAPTAAAPRTSLVGPHQAKNAAVAHAALAVLRRGGWRLPEPAVRRGFLSARWPGRFERFTLKAGENRINWILDGAHNVPAAKALRATMASERVKNVDLVFGVLRDKDVRGIAAQLAPVARRVSVVPVASVRSARPASVARLRAWKGRATPFRSLDGALRSVQKRAFDATVLVTGSLYLIGEARAWLREQGATTFHRRIS